MDIRKMIVLGMLGGGVTVDPDLALNASIAEWQADTTKVHGGGIPAADFVNNNKVTPNNLYFVTVIGTGVNQRIRQDGFIYGAKVLTDLVDANSTIKFIVLRANGANYDLVSVSETFPFTTTGTIECTFAAPLACQVGDYFGCVGMNTTAVLRPRIDIKTNAASTVGYVWADVAASNTLNSIPGDLDIEALTQPPMVAVTGDSIPAGWAERQSWYDAFTGLVTYDPVEQLQLLSPTLYYQNHSSGDKEWSWILSTGIVSALAVKPKFVIIHCGVNDIDEAVAWETVVASMDAVKALCDAAGATMLIDEILPWTNGTDAQAGTIRTFNTNYAAWCTANSVALVSMHDAFGKIRAATGELDDLADAYDNDGVHLTLAGKQKLAALWKAAIKANL